jgi:lipid II isoglutaminyl synthase (glutamine-hydrolysing)
MKITIAQLYPRDMNLYGDWGNTLVLKKRLERRGFEVEIIDHNPGDSTDFSKIDIFVGGGGQDSGQTIIQNDLLARADELRQLAKNGVPMLMICGMYQLFGRFFRTLKGEEIVGANILPIETIAGDERMIGNIVIRSQEFGDIVGYENHSGQTFLDKTTKPLGQVIKGAGNNSTNHLSCHIVYYTLPGRCATISICFWWVSFSGGTAMACCNISDKVFWGFYEPRIFSQSGCF